MANTIKRLILSCFIVVLFIQNIAPIKAVNDRKIVELQNRVGPYYGVDVTKTEAVTTSLPTPLLNTEEPTVVPSVDPQLPTPEPSSLPIATTTPSFFPQPINSSEPSPEVTIDSNASSKIAPIEFNLEEQPLPYVAEEGFVFEKAVDENTLILVSEEDPTLKQVIMAGESVGYSREGLYYPIDKSLQETPTTYSNQSAPYGWQNQTNTIQSYYPFQIDSQGVLLTKDQVQISITPNLKMVGQPEIMNNQIVYPMENQVNLRYQILAGKVKEDIIIYEKTDQFYFDYTLSVQNGTVHFQQDVVTILDEQNNPALLIRAPKAYDAKKEETSVKISIEDQHLRFEVAEDWLKSEQRVYPITIDPDYIGMAHHGIDISVTQNEPNRTLSNPDMAALNWVLDNHEEGYMYLGNHPTFQDTHSFYKILQERIDTILKGKYIKSATLGFSSETISKDNILYACIIPGTYNIQQANYLNMPTNFECESQTPLLTTQSNYTIDISDYLRSVVEEGKPNNGVMLNLGDDTGYAVFRAHEYFYVNGYSGEGTPWTSAVYYDTPEVTITNVEDFTYKLRPFVKNNYQEGLTYLLALGFDGVAPLGSTVDLKVKTGDQVVLSQQMKADSRFFDYPDYPTMDGVLSYLTLESNFQTEELMESFDVGKLYEVSLQAKKAALSSSVKSTTFMVHKVTGFGLLKAVANFYGVSIEQLKKDNNMKDELLTEGNLLWIREPTRNQGITYIQEDLTQSDKVEIDGALRGRNLQCQFGYEPINLNTGNFILESQDFAWNVLENTMQFTRTYNSTSANNFSIFGYGWTYSGFYALSSTSDTTTVIMEDGHKLLFRKEADGSYYNKITDAYTLKWVSDHFELIHADFTVIFNHRGQIVSKIDRLQRAINYQYENTELKQIHYPDGKAVNFTLTEGLVTSLQLSDGTSIAYSYDENLNLISFTDQIGSTIQYVYDNQHHLTQWINAKGELVVSNTYDQEHRIVRQQDDKGQGVQFTYLPNQTEIVDDQGRIQIIKLDGLGQTSQITYPDGNTTQLEYNKNHLVKEITEGNIEINYQYDQSGNLIEKVSSTGLRESWVYDVKGNVIESKDSTGKATSYTYDQQNHLLSETDVYNNKTTYQVNSLGQKTQEVNPLMGVTNYEYNDQGRVSKIIYPDLTWETYTYNEAGYCTSITDHHGNVTALVLNQRNELIEEHNPDGSIHLYQYDQSGNLIEETNTLQGKTTYVRDSFGRVLKQTDPLGLVSDYQYDAQGNILSKIQSNGSTMTYRYDERGRKIEETHNGLTTQIDYGPFGPLVETNAKGQQKKYTYNDFGYLVKTEDIDGKSLQYQYDSSGRCISQQDERGRVTEFTYDLLGRIIREKTEEKSIETTYDALDHVLTVTTITANSKKMIENTYDLRGNCIATKDAMGNVTYKEYDGIYQIADVDALGARTAYVLDGRGRVTKELKPDGGIFTYQYQGENEVVLKTDSLGHATSYKYNLRNELIEEVDALGNSTIYQRDLAGQIIRKITPMGIVWEYEYDLQGNLLSEIQNGRKIKEARYDSWNRLIWQRVAGVESTMKFNEWDQLIETLSATGLKTQYEYDSWHRLVKTVENGKVIQQVEYDRYDRVTQQTDRYGMMTRYSYNADGNQIEEIQDKLVTFRQFNLNNLIVEAKDSLGNLSTMEYDAKSQLIHQVKNGADYYWEYDACGRQNKSINSLGFETSQQVDTEGNLILSVDAVGVTTTQEFDELNRLVTKKLEGDVVNQWVYDADGRVVKEIDALGGVTQTLYDDFNQIIGEINALGYKTEYQYDDRGNQIEIRDAKNNKTIKNYDKANRYIGQIDALGYSTVNQLDCFGQIIATTDALGNKETKEYNDLQQLIKEVKKNGLVLTYLYNNQNQVVEMKADGVIQKRYEYNEAGQLIVQSDAMGHVTKYEYDSLGNKIMESDALGQRISYEYNKENQCIRKNMSNGLEIVTTYDGNGMVISTQTNDRQSTQKYDAQGNCIEQTDGLGYSTFFEYDLKGQLIKSTNPLGAETWYTYDALGHRISQVDSLNNKTETIYDEVGNEVQSIDALGYRITKSYDSLNRCTEIQDARGNRVIYQLDGMGNIISQQGLDQKETTYRYDAMGQIIKIRYADKKEEKFSYDSFGNPIQQIQKDKTVIQTEYDAKGNVIRQGSTIFEYDDLDRMIKMTDNQGITTISYDQSGNIITTNRNGQVVKNQWNLYNEKISVTYPDGSCQTFEYDNRGQLVLTSTPQMSIVYMYDEAGQLILEEQSTGTKIQQSYNLAGQLIDKKTTVNGKQLSHYQSEYDARGSLIHQWKTMLNETTETTHTYNENDELIETTQTKAGITQKKVYTYSLQGNKVELNDGQVIKRMQYNDMNQLTYFSDGTYSYQLRYDDNGNRTKEIRQDGKVKTYKYDKNNRLIEVVDFDQQKIEITYDGLGNREKQTISRKGKDYHERVSVIRSMDQLIIQLDQVNEETYSFYQTTKQTKEKVDYDALIKQYCKTLPVVSSNQTVTEYIESETTLTKKWTTDRIDVSEIEYVNDLTQQDSEVLTQIHDGKVMNYYYGNQRIGNDESVYQTSLNGSVELILTIQNQIQQQISYSDFGNMDKVINPFTQSNEFGYNGEAHTADGLQYLRARYYDPRTEVFIQQDSYRGDKESILSQNRYTYALNNPYKYIDPSGHWNLWDGIKQVVNTVVKTVTNVVKTVVNVVNHYVVEPVRKAVQAITSPPASQKKESSQGAGNYYRPSTTSYPTENFVRDFTDTYNPTIPYTPPTPPRITYFDKAGNLISKTKEEMTAEALIRNNEIKTGMGKAKQSIAPLVPKIRLNYSNQTKQKIKELQETEVKGSLWNKVTGICKDIEKNTKSFINDLGKECNKALSWIDNNLDKIAKVASGFATGFIVFGFTALTWGTGPVLVLGGVVLTGFTMAISAGVIAGLSAVIEVVAGTTQVITGVNGYTLDGRAIETKDIDDRIGQGTSNIIDGFFKAATAIIQIYIGAKGNSPSSGTTNTPKKDVEQGGNAEGASGAEKVKVPDKARDIVSKIEANKGTPPHGYKGGGAYNNQPKLGGQKLPEGVLYKEYDINPFIKGQGRGLERIVIGNDGSVWYTNDHYTTFTKIK